MNNVNVTEIKGTDSMNNSRVTINDNFKTLADAVNDIGGLINDNEIGNQASSEFKGAEASIGGVTLREGSIRIGSVALDANDFEAIRSIINDYLAQH